MKYGRSLLFLSVVLVLTAGCTVSPGPSNATPTVPVTGTVGPDAHLSSALARFTEEVTASLEDIDRNVSSAATELGRTGIAGPAANATLARLADSSTDAADAVTISADGRIAAVMPEQYWPAVGTDVGNESHNRQALQERQPQMTGVFRAAEGFDAVSIRWPVTAGSGAFLGLVSVLIEPARMLAESANRSLAGTAYTAWAIDTNGLLIYDRDPSDLVGRNMTTDPAYGDYPELTALVKRMMVEPAGSGTYSFTPTGGGAAVTKAASWATVGLHGTEWRLLVAREV